MRTTVIIEKRGKGYICSIIENGRLIKQGVRCGLDAFAAAASASKMMAQYSANGANLLAPPEVLEIVPENLRKI